MDREQALFSALSREENAKSVLLSLHLKQTQSIELISNALEHAARVYEEKKQLEENINLQEERMRAIESERITEKKKIEMQMRTQTAETHQFIRQLSQWENSKCLWMEEKRQLEQQVDSEVRIRKELEKEITELQSKEKERAKLEWKQTAKEFQSKEKKIIQTISCTQQRMQSLQGYMERVNAKLSAYGEQIERMKQDRAGRLDRYNVVDKEESHSDRDLLQLMEEKEARRLLQEECDTMRIENVILKTRNEELERTSSTLQESLKSIRERIQVQENVIKEYESSSCEGTKVIAMLQDALDEAFTSSNSMEKRADVMLREAEQRYLTEKDEMTGTLDRYKTRITQLEAEIEKTFQQKLLERLKSEKNVTNCIGNVMETDRQEPTDQHAAPTTSDYPFERTEIDKSNDTLRLPGEQIDPYRTENAEPPVCICSTCREEGFGFMVKCHKCKDPFHARCIKLAPSKKRSIVTFTCSRCRPPLRPEKMRKS
uniref:Viral Atype inclusion protein putative n=1 Tax=Albugo laibachii Nc14 TaxID=890382 RepID=F0WF63_9STRA|nr:viral Atype inclusion protein putative [Albugo laibachii Nc14]|eukprot:CCA19845.1 viral Atype inclusion protein putative [Albugo laibachii Nc14]